MRAVNAVFSPAPFVFNDDGSCVSLIGIPPLSSGEKPAEHRLPVIGLNGGLTSSPIPASDLNRPLSDEGLSVDVWDITDSEMWQNASAQLQTYLFPRLKALAESGDTQAQSLLGKCYFNGSGVKKDVKEAVEWYRKASEQGDAAAQLGIGWCYANGEGVAQDYTEAVKWYRKAAEQGLAEAQGNLGVAYLAGDGVVKKQQKESGGFKKPLLREMRILVFSLVAVI